MHLSLLRGVYAFDLKSRPCQITIDAAKNICADCLHEFAWQLCTWYISVDETIPVEIPAYSEVKPNSAQVTFLEM